MNYKKDVKVGQTIYCRGDSHGCIQTGQACEVKKVDDGGVHVLDGEGDLVGLGWIRVALTPEDVPDTYRIGTKVKIVDEWPEGGRQNDEGEKDKYLGTVMTIRVAFQGLHEDRDLEEGVVYYMEEDKDDRCPFEFGLIMGNPSGGGWGWYPEMIAGLAE